MTHQSAGTMRPDRNSVNPGGLNNGLRPVPNPRRHRGVLYNEEGEWQSEGRSMTTIQAGRDEIRASDSIERRTREIGRELFAEVGHGPSIADRAWWDDRVMALTMDDSRVKVQLFRFIDALPALTSDESVGRHLREYLGQAGDAVPWFLNLGVKPRPRGIGPREAPGPVREGLGHPHGPPVHRGLDPLRGARDRQGPPETRGRLHRRPPGRGGHLRAEAEAYQATCIELLRGLAPPLPRAGDRSDRPISRPGRSPGQPLAQADQPDPPVRRPPLRVDHAKCRRIASGRSSGSPASPGRSSTSTWSNTPTRT